MFLTRWVQRNVKTKMFLSIWIFENSDCMGVYFLILRSSGSLSAKSGNGSGIVYSGLENKLGFVKKVFFYFRVFKDFSLFWNLSVSPSKKTGHKITTRKETSRNLPFACCIFLQIEAKRKNQTGRMYTGR